MQETDSLYTELRLSLSDDVRVVPQLFRGVRWFVLKDDTSGRFVRVNQDAYRIVSLMNGKRTVARIADKLAVVDPTESDEQMQRVEAVVKPLLSAGYLRSDDALESEEQAKLRAQKKRKERWGRFLNPLFIKQPLLNPDSIISRISPLFSFVFSKASIGIWLVLMLIAITVGLEHSASIFAALDTTVFQIGNTTTLILAFALIKLLHEIGHAVAIKHWGGEVNEAGITLLVFSPIPYVDASSAWEFQDKRKRMVVSAMGVIVEMSIAAVALLVWLSTAPGTVNHLALNCLVIASFSTLLFNANPLLRFDGYYLLQDWIEIPNLYARSAQYLKFLIARFIAQDKAMLTPAYDVSERKWLLGYGLLALVYRLVLMVVIAVYLINTLHFVGIILTALAISTQIAKPIVQAMRYLLHSPNLDANRTRSLISSGCTVALLLGLSTWVPLPSTTAVKGVVSMQEQAQVFSPQAGFIEELLVESGDEVTAGTVLLRLHAPDLDAEIRGLQARKQELQMLSQSVYVKSGGTSSIHKSTLAALTAELEKKELDRQHLTVRAQSDGTFFSPKIAFNKGLHLKRGALIGYVYSPEKVVVNAVLSQRDIGLVRRNVESIQIRPLENPALRLSASISGETPSSSNQLPSKALGTSGGGSITVVSTEEQPTATEEYFELELSLDEPAHIDRIGAVVMVRMKHPNTPLVAQVAHKVKQLYMHTVQI